METTLKTLSGSIDSRYGSGTTRVWYQKPSFFRDGTMGYEWLVEQNMVPSLATLESTHVLVGTVDTTNTEEVYMMMQGENWSPRGEANGFIRSLGLKHTSMSMGDVVQVGEKLFIVDSFGFQELKAA